MNTSPDGIAVMHFYERCVLTAYPDPASPLFAALQRARIDPYSLKSVPAQFAHLSGAPWTIAWGDTENVTPGLTITQAEADERLAKRLTREFEPAVNTYVHRDLEQRQFDGLVSLAYNIGVRNFRNSTLLRKLNAGDIGGASAQFLVWVNGNGKPMLGLKRRRVSERALFDGMSANLAINLGQSIK